MRGEESSPPSTTDPIARSARRMPTLEPGISLGGRIETLFRSVNTQADHG